MGALLRTRPSERRSSTSGVIWATEGGPSVPRLSASTAPEKQMAMGAVTIKWERMSGSRVRAFRARTQKNKKEERTLQRFDVTFEAFSCKRMLVPRGGYFAAY